MSHASATLTGMTGLSDLRLRNESIRALQAIGPRLIYAVRTGDDLVKIGSSARLIDRLREIKGGVSEILALKPGDWPDELAIHHRLTGHATDGREYYFPSKGVLREVNAMRSPLGLEPLVFERRWAD